MNLLATAMADMSVIAVIRNCPVNGETDEVEDEISICHDEQQASGTRLHDLEVLDVWF